MASPIADFDSAMAMTRALSNYLKGADFPLLGAMPRSRELPMKVVAGLVNELPVALREWIYIWSGRFEAVSARKLGAVDMERVARSVVSLYPRRKYAAVAIGSSNGAATHLWAALGIPWLPQTLLIPVARSGFHPDDPEADALWGREPAAALLGANPDIQLHHMHDPVQDRLMIQKMTYFRVKRLRLGKAYEEFLRECLEPGGTIVLVECGTRWPTTRYGERHFFQFGALGGATQDEYFDGGPRVEKYLARYDSPRRRWDPPRPDGQSPEAEWGFEARLRDDVVAFAARHGLRVKHLCFEFPEDLSQLAANFYIRWNERRGIAKKRLVVDSFILMEPHWTVRTGSVPFWMLFNTEGSAAALSRYLDYGSFEEIALMLFSHGVESIGVVPIGYWKSLLARAQRGMFIGVDPYAYPRDFATFVRYHGDFIAKISDRYELPPALSLGDLEAFIENGSKAYPVELQ